MARVLLVMPRLPQRLTAPYLGQLYVAAALLQDGHEVKAIDLAAPYWEGGEDAALSVASSYGPDIIAMTLFTYNAARGYALAEKLRPMTRILVAGGPHPTVMPGEPVRHGFDVSIAGEGEARMVALARWADGEGSLSAIPGASFKGGQGPMASALEDLDALAYPHLAYSCFDMGVYSPGGETVVSGGLMTSRGCPARCTFCANYVTGRAFRWRSVENVVQEMVALRSEYGITTFPFWDDAFTARRPRINALCDAILAEPDLEGITWTCITPGNMVKPIDLERMRRAGCVAVNFGIESGDPYVLKAIQKGQKPDDVRAAVKAAKSAGMMTVVNFMFGFPEEDADALRRTQDLMVELSDDTDYFNTRGVLVPFPGTQIYDRWADTYDLRDWWLDLDRVPIEPDGLEPDVDPTLDIDFFRYSDDVREQIEACVRFKADHNADTLRRLQRGVGMMSYASPQ